MMVGNQVAYQKRHKATPRELEIWAQKKQQFAQQASRGIRSEEALAYVKHPGWQWHGDAQK